MTRDIQLAVDGTPQGFRLTKPNAFSGMALLRVLMRPEQRIEFPMLPDFIASLSEEDPALPWPLS